MGLTANWSACCRSTIARSKTRPILEINLRHPLVAAIARAEAGSATTDDLSLLLLEQAQILDGELPEDPAQFVRRMNQLVLEGPKTH
jgi:molecular chaperone HtpG